MIVQRILFFCAVTLAPVNAPHTKTYRNPIIEHIGPADPAVIRYEDKYYLYPTWDGKGYHVFVSDDLIHWQQKPKCYEDARGTEEPFR